ncbi:BPTI/Kunitz domain-containing protein [Astyanax mexicanus]|uniref:Boophilin-G2-like n=3 Tax=Astyanax mexicanus TaxID=7994 RepID=A0A8B9KJ34_ASTMX|nr:BPTI/Kunitz domain-containing protein [Astyanax mexicanus]KAG9281015.1 boophilin-G2-like [Astyanax mexicanus]
MSPHSLRLHPTDHTTAMKDLNVFLLFFAVFYSTKGQTTAPSICDLPKDEGTGSDVKVYLYYDKVEDKCFPFRYMGEGGNGNRFTAEHLCMRNCSARAEELYPSVRSDSCHLPKAPGDCYGAYLRYYYDSLHAKCKTFYWTGCVGNGNRFLDIQRCNDTCFGILDAGEEKEEEVESDTPIGIILGVALGIIGAIILIVVLVLTLKPSSKKSKAKAKEVSKDASAPGPELPLQEAATEMA